MAASNFLSITSKSGSFATDVLPTATTQPATFDLNDRKTSFNGQALTYDANGNLTGDGTNTYSWNARNQLTAISQGGTAQMSYAYDALGRRISKAVQGGAPTQFLYDGTNAVQETQDSNINAILVGLGVDERFARNDVTGRTYFLADQLNSTVALTDANGAIKQQYSYDPYGNVTASDTTTGFTNPYQFTGREADAPGLYYYRARYYSPLMGGFISEDPARGSGGQPSYYAYVGGNPINNTDSSGMFLTSVDAACMQAPQLCAEIFGDIARSEGSIQAKLGMACAQEAGDAAANLFDALGKIGAAVQIAGSGLISIEGDAAPLFGGRAIEDAEGYIQAEGSPFKFPSGYYDKLWNSGRGAPFLTAQEVLDTATSTVPDSSLTGFFKYSNGYYEMVYSPGTGIVWHLQPIW